MDATSFDCALRKVAIDPEMTKVGQQKPVEGFADPLWFWRLQHSDLNQVVEETLDRTPHRSSGGIATNGVVHMSVVSLQESFDVSRTQLITARDALLQQKAIELAALAKDLLGVIVGISTILEESGKAIKMRTYRATPEINQGAFFFVPIFEHRLRRVFG